MGGKSALRDFIYLDWDRVRSLAAQLLQGVPQDATTKSSSDVTSKAGIQAGIPILKGQFGQDVRYLADEHESLFDNLS